MRVNRLLLEISAIFTKEIRCLLRDQHTVLHSLLIPLFLYPVLVWGVIQVVQYSRGVQEREISKVRLIAGQLGASLDEHLQAHKIELLQTSAEDVGARQLSVETESDAEFIEQKALAVAAYTELKNEIADAWVIVREADERDGEQPVDEGSGDEGSGGLGGLGGDESGGDGLGKGRLAPTSVANLEFLVFYSSADDASVQARERIDAGIEDFRKARIEAESTRLGMGEAFYVPLAVDEEDVATAKELSNRIASLILPLLMLIMTALGALYPALDVTVGERERGSLETTLLSPVTRSSIVMGKYLAVVIFSVVAFLLNFSSMGVTFMHLGSSLRMEGFEVSVAAISIILAATILLSLLFSAIMMLLAFQARTFKEGQSYLMSVYLLAVIPAFVMAIPEASFSSAVAWVPVVNIALLFRKALSDDLSTYFVVATLLSSTLYTAVIVSLSVLYLRRLDVIAGAEIRSRKRFWPFRRTTARS